MPPRTPGYMACTDIGRTASHFYLNAQSIEFYNENFRETMHEADIFAMVSQFSEFENIQVLPAIVRAIARSQS